MNKTLRPFFVVFITPGSAGSARGAERTQGGSLLLSKHPNPFNSNAFIGFASSADFGARLRQCDLDNLDAGRREVIRDGRNNCGEPLASGINFLKLEF